jgi:hypothetical protein
VLDYFALGYKELVDGGLSFADAGREAEARAVQQIGIEEAIVPRRFSARARRPCGRTGSS